MSSQNDDADPFALEIDTGDDSRNQLLPLIAEKFDGVSSDPSGFSGDILHDLPATWPVRDQGGLRGTCSAFAANAAVELWRVWHNVDSPARDFSEEYLYSRMRTEYALPPDNTVPGYDDQGATLFIQAANCLNKEGVCLENQLEYAWDEDEPGFVSKIEESHITAAKGFRDAEGTYFSVVMNEAKNRPTDAISLSIRFLLQNRVPVCAAFPIFDENGSNPWQFGHGWHKGQIGEPELSLMAANAAGRTPDGAHSVCIVGYKQDPSSTDDGWFLFRNSWGRRFAHMFDLGEVVGRPEVPGRGYGYISKDHVDELCWELMFRAPVANPPTRAEDDD